MVSPSAGLALQGCLTPATWGRSLWSVFSPSSSKGSSAWFISVIIVGCHRASEYHTTLCLGSGNIAAIVFFPTDGANWQCQKSSVNCTVLTCSRQNLWNNDKEDLAESTGVVPVKYPPKVKLERISTTLKCQRWENYAYLDLWGFWGF